MPRPTRHFEEGRFYHVYNRVGGGLAPFEDEGLCRYFIDRLRQVAKRDELVILAWSLLPNHYHVVVRQGPVDLSRPMKTLQQRITRLRNLRADVAGPMWQGRFKAKVVADSSYLLQLVAYVHLNPVKAGLSSDAAGYRWSGHVDILGRRRPPLVALDETLTLYGESRRAALSSYRSVIAATGAESWSGEGPGGLPWWPRGRPAADDRLRIRETAIDEAGRSTARWRPHYSASDWLDLACSALAIDRDALASRTREPAVVRAREVVGLVGIERFGVKVGELARELGKSRDGVSRWYRRGAVRREKDPEFAAAAQQLEIAAGEEP